MEAVLSRWPLRVGDCAESSQQRGGLGCRGAGFGALLEIEEGRHSISCLRVLEMYKLVMDVALPSGESESTDS